MPLVSIVVPVYKVEKYLERCVESLRGQTLKEIEIILVDDGSPDRSGTICDELQKLDERIRVIHKTNGGLSSARNAGMAAATGKYIGFVDSDDDVEPDMYEKMYLAAERENVDFVMADYVRIREDGSRYLKTLKIREGLYKKEDLRQEIFPQLIMGEDLDYGPLLSVWHCLYRTEFLCANHLQFDEEVRWSEDNIFSAVAGYCADSFYYLKGAGLYHYHQNPGTITTSYRKGAWQIYSTMNRHLHDFFDWVEDYDFSRQLKLHMIYYACNSIGQEFCLPEKEAKKAIRQILESEQLKDAFSHCSMPNVSWKLKIQLYLMRWRQTGLLYRLKKS
ncbi:MAG: glycosyltransferase family 2 protein [Fusicatenibacter sp.]|nr:glycosyltransferase family 2 protein [Lachnospiraceae bacterium]MDY2938248.1 glycosyltransferase family 2 protein [Fusicatenibacter sp.]